MPGLTQVQTTLNGEVVNFLCEPRQSLLECLRDVLGMTGTKEGCNDGNCGACSVIMDGTLVDSCLVLAVEIQGKEITTVEGLATVDGLHPLQQKFLENASLQCGICTPGIAMMASAALAAAPHASRARMRELMAGNLCRCTGYQHIVNSVQHAAKAAPSS